MNVGRFRTFELTISTIYKMLQGVGVDIVISGSFAMYLLGLLKEGREVKDIDLAFNFVDMDRIIGRLHEYGIQYYQCHYEMKNTETVYFTCEVNGVKVDLLFKHDVKVCKAQAMSLYGHPFNHTLLKEIVVEGQEVVVQLDQQHHLRDQMTFKTPGYVFNCLIHDPREIMNAKAKLIKQNDFKISDMLNNPNKRSKVIKHLKDYIFAKSKLNEMGNPTTFDIINSDGRPFKMDCKVEINGVSHLFKDVQVNLDPKEDLNYSDEEYREIPWQD